MARGKGHQGIVAFVGGGATWGTAVECGAGTGFYARNFKISGGNDGHPDMSITGAYSQRISTVVAKRATASFECDLSYQGNSRAIMNLFGGTSATPTTVDTSAYQHVAKFADRDAIFGTMAYEGIKDTTVVEGPSVQFNKLTLAGKSGEVFTLSMEGMADTVKIDSSVNTTTTIDTTTVLNYAPVPFGHASFLLNDQTAGSLASAPIYVSGIEITIDRPIKENINTERGSLSSLFIPNGFATGKLKVDYTIAQNGTGGNLVLITDHLAGTPKKAKLILTSTTLAGAATQMFQHVIWLPNLRSLPTDILPVNGPEGITWSQEYEFAVVASAPTGFTSGYSDGIVWEFFDQISTNPLA
jgi:hypothetical protein